MKSGNRRQFLCHAIGGLFALSAYTLLSGCRSESSLAPSADTPPLPASPTPTESASPSLPKPSPKGVVLKGKTNAEAVFKQCSRNAPQKVDGYWDPSPDDIARLEAEAHSQKWAVPREKTTVRFDNYHRQYFGYIRAGHRFIYVNAFSSGTIDKKRVSTIPINICDGGSHFWGVEYDVDAKKFLNFSPNGFV